jgi:hypothetical protein
MQVVQRAFQCQVEQRLNWIAMISSINVVKYGLNINNSLFTSGNPIQRGSHSHAPSSRAGAQYELPLPAGNSAHPGFQVPSPTRLGTKRHNAEWSDDDSVQSNTVLHARCIDTRGQSIPWVFWGFDALEWRVKSRWVWICKELSGFLYAESHQHFCNLTNMCWKPSACFGLHVGIVPKEYHRVGPAVPSGEIRANIQAACIRRLPGEELRRRHHPHCLIPMRRGGSRGPCFFIIAKWCIHTGLSNIGYIKKPKLRGGRRAEQRERGGGHHAHLGPCVQAEVTQTWRYGAQVAWVHLVPGMTSVLTALLVLSVRATLLT